MSSEPATGIASFAEYARTVRADLYRYEGRRGGAAMMRTYLREPGFRYTFWLRTAQWLSGRRALAPLAFLARWWRHHLEIRYGISIPVPTRVGPGLFIGHFGGIVVNERAIIGRNCNLSHGVTIGQMNRGKRKGVPTIGDSVFIGPGAMILGKVTVGSSVAVGANSVVVNDIPTGGVAIGAPARVVSMDGSQAYVEWTADHSDVEQGMHASSPGDHGE